jgi:hypothetical protein
MNCAAEIRLLAANCKTIVKECHSGVAISTFCKLLGLAVFLSYIFDIDSNYVAAGILQTSF